MAACRICSGPIVTIRTGRNRARSDRLGDGRALPPHGGLGVSNIDVFTIAWAGRKEARAGPSAGAARRSWSTAPHRGRGRRARRADEHRPPQGRKRRAAARQEGPRGRHPPRHGDAASLSRRRHHRHQKAFPTRVASSSRRRSTLHDPRCTGCGAVAGEGDLLYGSGSDRILRVRGPLVQTKRSARSLLSARPARAALRVPLTASASSEVAPEAGK